jgi:hypothetical protein
MLSTQTIIDLVDTLGRLTKQRTIVEAEIDRIKVQLRSLPTGVYRGRCYQVKTGSATIQHFIDYAGLVRDLKLGARFLDRYAASALRAGSVQVKLLDPKE